MDAFLCRAGARIDVDLDASKLQRKTKIIAKLQRNPTLQNARRDYMNLYNTYNTLAKAALNPKFEELSDKGSGDYYWYFYYGLKWDKWFAQAWESMEIVFGWNMDELVGWEGDEWPMALSSEEEWKSWHIEVLEILRPFWGYHCSPNPPQS
jgi:hypothetical protein